MNNISTDQIRSYQKILTCFLHKKFQNHDLVEDVVQETFLKALTNIGQYDKTRSFESWLFGIAENTMVDEIRHEQVVNKFFKDPTITAHGSIESPDVYCDNKAVSKRIFKELNSITSQCKDVFVDAEINDMSFEEISKKRNIPLNRALFKSYYCKKMLRKRLEDLRAYLN